MIKYWHSMRRNGSNKSYLLIVIVMLFAGCENRSNADLVNFVDSTYKNEKPKIEPLPPVKPYEEFIYNAQDLVDPFDIGNVRVGEVESDEEEVDTRRREPLESYSLDALRLDGVIDFKNKLSAIIRTPDGVFPVIVGNYIGLNEGKILSINSEEQIVEIEERFKNAIGLWERRVVKMVSRADENTSTQ